MTLASAGSPKGGDAKLAPSRSDDIAVGVADAPNPIDLRLAYARIVKSAISRALRAETDPVLSFSYEHRSNEKEAAANEAADQLLALKATHLIGLSQGEGLAQRMAESVGLDWSTLPDEPDAACGYGMPEGCKSYWRRLSGLSLPGRDAIQDERDACRRIALKVASECSTDAATTLALDDPNGQLLAQGGSIEAGRIANLIASRGENSPPISGDSQ